MVDLGFEGTPLADHASQTLIGFADGPLGRSDFRRRRCGGGRGLDERRAGHGFFRGHGLFGGRFLARLHKQRLVLRGKAGLLTRQRLLATFEPRHGRQSTFAFQGRATERLALRVEGFASDGQPPGDLRVGGLRRLQFVAKPALLLRPEFVLRLLGATGERTHQTITLGCRGARDLLEKS